MILMLFITHRYFFRPLVLNKNIIRRRIRRRTSTTPIHLTSGLLRVLRHTMTQIGNAMINRVVTIITLKQKRRQHRPRVIGTRINRVIRFHNSTLRVTRTIAIQIRRKFQMGLMSGFVFGVVRNARLAGSDGAFFLTSSSNRRGKSSSNGNRTRHGTRRVNKLS